MCRVPVRATPAELAQRPEDSVLRWTGAPGDLRLTNTQLTVSPPFMAFARSEAGGSNQAFLDGS